MEEATRFGYDRLTPQNSQPEFIVLLRGVDSEVREVDRSLAKGDEFNVYWHEGVVEVNHLARRAQGALATNNKAVLAVLPGLPTEVYPNAMAVTYGGFGPN